MNKKHLSRVLPLFAFVSLLFAPFSYGKLKIFDVSGMDLHKLSMDQKKENIDPFGDTTDNSWFKSISSSSNPFPKIIRGDAFEIKKLLAQAGILFGEADFAYYYPDHEFILIKAGEKSIDNLNKFFATLGPDPVKIVYYSFTLQSVEAGETKQISSIKVRARSGETSSIQSPHFDAAFTPILSRSDSVLYFQYVIIGKGILENHATSSSSTFSTSQNSTLGEWSGDDANKSIQLILAVKISELDPAAILKKERQEIYLTIEQQLKKEAERLDK